MIPDVEIQIGFCLQLASDKYGMRFPGRLFNDQDYPCGVYQFKRCI